MIRKTTEKDFNMLFNWINDEDVIHNSRHQRETSLEEYTKWFNEKLIDDKSDLFIVEINDEKVGQIKLEQNHNEVLISYSIDKANRGKGYGKHAIYAVEEYIMVNKNKFKDILNLVAYVKADNIASIKVFEHLGYIREIDNENFIKFIKHVYNKDCNKIEV